MKNSVWVVALGAILLATAVYAQEQYIATLRGEVDLDAEAEPPRMPQANNASVKQTRNYPMQPPTIPHKVDGYQVDLNANKCMSCHSRRRTEESQAPMVSVTHYMDRDGNFLAEVSPRRYFCSQCHVVQTETQEAVESDFKDVDMLIQSRRADGGESN